MTSFDEAEIDAIVSAALAEDIGLGDLTSEAVIPPDQTLSAIMAAREDMVVAGLPLALVVFERLAPEGKFSLHAQDGDKVAPGAVLMRVSGPGAALLTAERTALNIVQHLSGIATLTRRYVDEIAGTGAILLDTRKTIPGLRQAAKYATRQGGAQNHRMRLDDGVLIKDNHIAICGGIGAAVNACKAKGLAPVEVECDTLTQMDEALAAGADIILLDNMDNDTLRRAVATNSGLPADQRAKLEASGGVTLETIRGIAETGVDYISVGRITQSAPAVDIGLDFSD